jgi:hypothetical protein
MHRSKRLRKFRDGELTGRSVNTAVFGLLERHSEKGKSKVRAKVNPTAWRDDVRETIRMTAEQGTSVYSDEHGAYRGLETEGFRHDFV